MVPSSSTQTLHGNMRPVCLQEETEACRRGNGKLSGGYVTGLAADSQISADLISSLKNIISCCDLWRRAHGHGPQGSEVTELRLTISQKLVRVYEEQELWCVTSGLFETQLRKSLSTEVMRFSMQPCPETLICMLTLYSKVWVWMPQLKWTMSCLGHAVLQCSFIFYVFTYIITE